MEDEEEPRDPTVLENVIFPLLTGLGLLAVGLYFNLAPKEDYVALFGAGLFDFSILVIVGGVIVSILSLTGVIAVFGSKRMKRAHEIVLLVFEGINTFAGIVILIYGAMSVPQKIYDNLSYSMYFYLNVSSIHNQWDHMQRDLECCGIQYYGDWFDIINQTKPLEPTRLPTSCCRPEHVCPNNGSTTTYDFDQINQMGCYEAVFNLINFDNAIIGALDTAVGIIHVIQLVIFKSIRKRRAKRYQKEIETMHYY